MLENTNIPEMALLLESMNGAFTTESIVTNSGEDHSLSDRKENIELHTINSIFED